ncbi:hypothetical protein ACFL6I_26745 [candidate division KSB1 bacterium]
MIDHCINMQQFFQEEMEALSKDPDFLNEKWYRSEEAHHDVGFRAAFNSFSRTEYFVDFCSRFRKEYCIGKCEYKDECDIAHHYAEVAEES